MSLWVESLVPLNISSSRFFLFIDTIKMALMPPFMVFARNQSSQLVTEKQRVITHIKLQQSLSLRHRAPRGRHKAMRISLDLEGILKKPVTSLSSLAFSSSTISWRWIKWTKRAVTRNRQTDTRDIANRSFIALAVEQKGWAKFINIRCISVK